VQQFLVVGLFASSLRRWSGWTDRWVLAATALVFAAVHLPQLPLVVATAVMAVVTASTYFRVRNLWTLGVFHGVLATLVYYLVLGKDAWLELVAHGLGP
jgi:uncharacterized protein